MILKLYPRTKSAEKKIEDHGQYWTVLNQNGHYFLQSVLHENYTLKVQREDDTNFSHMVAEDKTKEEMLFERICTLLDGEYETWGRKEFANYVQTHHQQYQSVLFTLYDERVEE